MNCFKLPVDTRPAWEWGDRYYGCRITAHLRDGPILHSAAAKILGISRPHLYKLINLGWITPLRYKYSNRPYVYGRDIRRCFQKIGT